MFGLDEWVAHLTDNAWLFVLIISVLLGLRHATDPDHLSAMLTLRLQRTECSPARLGIAWGIGHGVTMMLIGTPLILLLGELPARLQQGMEFAVGIMIIALAARAIYTATRISAHQHEHAHHDGQRHAHPHTHGSSEHTHSRSALAMGLLHGAGGTAGVVALILARLDNPSLAVGALVVICVFSAVSMACFSWLMCRSLDRTVERVGQARVAIVGGSLTLLFGIWYCAAALEAAPYPF